MKDHGPALPRYYCPCCLAPYEPQSQYGGCPSCIEGQKEVTELILARAVKMNAPYWDEVVRREHEARRMLLAGPGAMVLSDGSIVEYENAAERAKWERINSVHVGADLRGPVLDESGNYVKQ